jgi:hypothetical protein
MDAAEKHLLDVSGKHEIVQHSVLPKFLVWSAVVEKVF